MKLKIHSVPFWQAEHSWQAVPPELLLKLTPSSQGSHVSCLSPLEMNPFGQGVGLVAPTEHEDPGGQSLHPLADERLVRFENVPAWQGNGAGAPCPHQWPLVQSLHAVAPVASCHLPASHRVQLCAPPPPYEPAGHSSHE